LRKKLRSYHERYGTSTLKESLEASSEALSQALGKQYVSQVGVPNGLEHVLYARKLLEADKYKWVANAELWHKDQNLNQRLIQFYEDPVQSMREIKELAPSH
jgi:hypothetical protein